MKKIVYETTNEISDVRIRLTEYIRTASENMAHIDDRLNKIEAKVNKISEEIAEIHSLRKIADR